MKRTRLLIESMWGMGDNIFQRPFVKLLSTVYDIYITTPWPELYQDLPVRYVKQYRNLRTQLKNISRQNQDTWTELHDIKQPFNRLRIGYRLTSGSIPSDFQETFQTGPDFKPYLDFPSAFHKPPPPPAFDKPIAIVRPATRRTEWSNTARNPKPEYINDIAKKLAHSHHVICVADLTIPDEILVGELPFAHTYYTKGEIAFPQLMQLVCASDLIIGGVGWIVPAAIAANKRAFVILGGMGGHNHPSRITMPYWQHKIGFAFPDNYCMCTNKHHDCPKTNSNLNTQFLAYLERFPHGSE